MSTTTIQNKSNGISSTGKGLPKKKSSDKKPSNAKPTTPTQAETTAAAPSTTTRKAKLPIARQYERKISNVAKRWHNLVRKTVGWAPALVAAMADVEEMIGEATKQMKAVGDDFVAPKKSGGTGGKPLEVGGLICITDKARAKYEGVLEKDEFDNLKVLVIHGNKIRVRTHAGKGTVLALPRGHVRPQKAAKAEETAEETGEE